MIFRKWLLVVILSAVGIVFAVSYCQKHWCEPVPFDGAWLDDQYLTGSSLYQCNDSTLVVWLEENGQVLDVFAIPRDRKKVGDLNSPDFVNFKSGLWTFEIPLQPSILGEVQAKNDDIDPKLMFEAGRIEFSPYGKETRIKILLPSHLHP